MTAFVVALGSESALKVAAVEAAIRPHYPELEVKTHRAESGVASQPEGFHEMLQGAAERAGQALKKHPEAEIGIGLESGMVWMPRPAVKGLTWNPIGDVCLWFDPAMAVIVNQKEELFVGFGPGFPIPEWAAEEARHSELGKVVMDRGAPDKNPMAYFSKQEVSRVDVLSWAVRCALMSYRHPDRYAKH